MKYKVLFGIDCGISNGYGLKSPDYHEQSDSLEADSHENAIYNVVALACKYADEHLSNPETALTVVKLLSIKDAKNQPVSLDSFMESRPCLFEKGTMTIKRTTLEHFMAFSSE